MDDRRSTTSIYMMAAEAIRKAVTYHHTRIGPASIDLQENLRAAVCAKIRDQPGGTLAIRTNNTEPTLPLKTVVAYRAPPAPGSRREAREHRRREAREARRRACHARGDPTHTLTFFSYDTDVTEEEPSEAEEAARPHASATSRKRRVRRSLIRRLSYYPPREPMARQVRVDFVNLEHGGADFTPPLYGEEYEEDGEGSSGMESDFDDEADPPVRPTNLPTLMPFYSGGAELDFSPTTSASHLVQSLSVASPPPILAPPGAAASVWGLGVGALGGSVPVAVPDADAAAARMWGATEAAWDAVPGAPLAAALPPSPAPFILRHYPDQILLEDEDFDPAVQRMIPHISDQERLGEGLAMGANYSIRRAPLPPNPIALPPAAPAAHPVILDGAALAAALNAAAAASAARPVTPAPPLPPLVDENQLRLCDELCAGFVTMGAFSHQVVRAYLHDRTHHAPLAYERLLLPAEREQFRRLHAAVEICFDEARWRDPLPPAAASAPEAPAAPVAAAVSAPPTPAPSSSSSAAPRIDTINLPGIGSQFIERNGDLPPTFTNRARMKRQREARAASAASIAEAHAAAAAHAARSQQGEDSGLVAGPSASFDHDRRKSRRVLEEPECSSLPTGSGVAGGAESAPPQLLQPLQQTQQRVLGAVQQQPEAADAAAARVAAVAAAATSVHSSSCPCVFCPSGLSHRHLPVPSSLQPFSPISQTQLDNYQLALQQQQNEARQAALMQQIRQIQQSVLPPQPVQPALQQLQQQIHHRSQQHLDLSAAIFRAQLQQQLMQHQPQQQLLQPQSVPVTTQNLADVLRSLQNSQQRIAPTNTTPALPRMDQIAWPSSYISTHYNPFASMAQPAAAVVPPSFVDLPDANPVLSRQHMFAQHTQVAASSSLSAAALAAAAGSRPEQQLQQGETSQQLTHDRAMAQWIQMHDNIDTRNLHFLLSAGLQPAGEAAPIGAAQRDIEKYSITQEWKDTGDTDVDPCTVCMSEFEEGESVRVLPCHHSFHVRCIDRWLSYNKKCPNCRVDLDQQAAAAAVVEPAAPAAPPAAPAQVYLLRGENQAEREQRVRAMVEDGTAAPEQQFRFIIGTPAPAAAPVANVALE